DRRRVRRYPRPVDVVEQPARDGADARRLLDRRYHRARLEPRARMGRARPGAGSAEPRAGHAAVKLALAVLALAACNRLPDPPDAEAFKHMTAKQRCRAAAPRAVRCADELVVATVKALDMGSAGDEIAEKLDDMPGATDDQAIAIHKTQCAADPHYPDAVLACWKTADCDAFASCVTKFQQTH